ncbi:MAG: YhfC family intramembrane metalloprotease [Ardenticatenia bacterium]|nr:MAG: YhfC family intramembrane metalloprotease [Ardenticatenia bacterium]
MLLLFFLVELVGVVLGPLAVAFWWRRRSGATWQAWFFGVATFTVSQLILRLPLLTLLTMALRDVDVSPSSPAVWVFNAVVLSFSAGLFEEWGRWFFLKYLAKHVRDFREGVMFGLGHGGIEAIVLVGLNVMGTLVLLLMGDAILAQLSALAPQDADAVRQQIEAVRTLPAWTPLLGLWERVLAMTLHVALTLLVVHAVRQQRRALVWLAVGWHGLFNLLALVVLRLTESALAVEVALTIATLASVWAIGRLREALTTEQMTIDSAESAC